MPRSKKRVKKKHKRKYGQQDKVVFKRIVHREVVEQECPLTLKEKVVLFRKRQRAGQEAMKRMKKMQEKIVPSGMVFSDYLQYLKKKKEEAREKGVHIHY